MLPDPPSGRASRALLRFAKYSDQVHTGPPLFKILDPPLPRLSIPDFVLQLDKYRKQSLGSRLSGLNRKVSM